MVIFQCHFGFQGVHPYTKESHIEVWEWVLLWGIKFPKWQFPISVCWYSSDLLLSITSRWDGRPQSILDAHAWLMYLDCHLRNWFGFYWGYFTSMIRSTPGKGPRFEKEISTLESGCMLKFQGCKGYQKSLRKKAFGIEILHNSVHTLSGKSKHVQYYKTCFLDTILKHFFSTQHRLSLFCEVVGASRYSFVNLNVL